ncbi:MAG TPA: class I SAM-dependent methyltransferase [Steroidobacteraceae bacterium]|jgi:hypothetical protein
MSALKTYLRERLPRPVVTAYDRFRRRQAQMRNQAKSTEQVFTDIYSRNEWGGEAGTFNSGTGSSDDRIVSPYVEALRAHLRTLGASNAVAVDLGCGDFRVGRRFAGDFRKYIGVDIVAPLIARNQRDYGNDRVSFVHANFIEDELPHGDICFVRQVFQHLSNAQILQALPRLAIYRHVLVTEHHPSDGNRVEFNLDKPHGGDIRVAVGSGVFLDKPPFNLPAERYRPVFEVAGVSAPGGRDPGVIRTYCLTSPAQRTPD